MRVCVSTRASVRVCLCVCVCARTRACYVWRTHFFVYNFEGPFDVFSKAISLIFEVVGMYVCVCRAI